jgi:DNA-directed RNA polymerase subunit RPC12/RpoP
MGTWQANRCPRCGGRLFIDNDMDGWYEQCINCSYRNELKEAVGLARVANTKATHYKGTAYRRNGDL